MFIDWFFSFDPRVSFFLFMLGIFILGVLLDWIFGSPSAEQRCS